MISNWSPPLLEARDVAAVLVAGHREVLGHDLQPVVDLQAAAGDVIICSITIIVEAHAAKGDHSTHVVDARRACPPG